MLRYHHTAGRLSPPETTMSWPVVATLQAFIGALREALAACRQYQHLTSRGVSHDTALREALAIGLSSAQTRCKAAKRLCFAGNA